MLEDHTQDLQRQTLVQHLLIDSIAAKASVWACPLRNMKLRRPGY